MQKHDNPCVGDDSAIILQSGRSMFYLKLENKSTSLIYNGPDKLKSKK